MTHEDIIRMAREAGFCWPNIQTMTIEQRLERFAALVAAAEREACAKVCIEHAKKYPYPSHAGAAATVCADAIRARKN